MYWFLEKSSKIGSDFLRRGNKQTQTRRAKSTCTVNEMKEWPLSWLPSFCVCSQPASLRMKNKGSLLQLRSLQPHFPILSPSRLPPSLRIPYLLRSTTIFSRKLSKTLILQRSLPQPLCVYRRPSWAGSTFSSALFPHLGGRRKISLLPASGEQSCHPAPSSFLLLPWASRAPTVILLFLECRCRSLLNSLPLSSWAPCPGSVFCLHFILCQDQSH